jgi:hypothetical protein
VQEITDSRCIPQEFLLDVRLWVFCRVLSIFSLPIKLGIIHQGVFQVGNDLKIENLSGASNFYFLARKQFVFFYS